MFTWFSFSVISARLSLLWRQGRKWWQQRLGTLTRSAQGHSKGQIRAQQRALDDTPNIFYWHLLLLSDEFLRNVLLASHTLEVEERHECTVCRLGCGSKWKTTCLDSKSNARCSAGYMEGRSSPLSHGWASKTKEMTWGASYSLMKHFLY